jgi:hypothetical protein
VRFPSEGGIKQPEHQRGIENDARKNIMTDPDILQTILKDSSFDLSLFSAEKKSNRVNIYGK